VILRDTGPLVALVHHDDSHHLACVEALSKLPAETLITTWPCLTEAMHLLFRADGLRAQQELWGFIVDGLVKLHSPSADE